MSEGVLTARVTAAQKVLFGVGVQSRLRLGSTSKPVKLLCSNFAPKVSCSLFSRSEIWSCA